MKKSADDCFILTLWYIHRSPCWQETNVPRRKDRHIVRCVWGHCYHQCGSGRCPRRPGIYLQVRRKLRLGWPRWISNEGICSPIGFYLTMSLFFSFLYHSAYTISHGFWLFWKVSYVWNQSREFQNVDGHRCIFFYVFFFLFNSSLISTFLIF